MLITPCKDKRKDFNQNPLANSCISNNNSALLFESFVEIHRFDVSLDAP
jgi:hypothetical protein